MKAKRLYWHCAILNKKQIMQFTAFSLLVLAFVLLHGDTVRIWINGTIHFPVSLVLMYGPIYLHLNIDDNDWKVGERRVFILNV